MKAPNTNTNLKKPKPNSADITIECTPVNEKFGRVSVSTDTGTKLFTALYSPALYKTKNEIKHMVKEVLSAMLESGKLSDNFLKK